MDGLTSTCEVCAVKRMANTSHIKVIHVYSSETQGPSHIKVRKKSG